MSHQKQGMIYYIALGMGMLDNHKVGISYSLPRMFMEAPDALAYYNMPALIVRESDSFKKEPIVPLDFDLAHEKFMYVHFNFFPLGDERILLGCKKLTWPIEFDEEDYRGQIDIDPFMDEFYDTSCPYLATFDTKTGKLIERFGQVDVPQRLSRTGYYYTEPVAAYHENDIIYGNGYMGKLYIANKKQPSGVYQELNVFDIDTENFPPLDSLSFYKLEHVKAYNSFFTKCIVSVALTADNVYCLIRIGLPNNPNIENDTYEFVSLDRKTGKVKNKIPLTKETPDERVLGYGLFKDSGNVTPYYFFKKNNRPYINLITSF